MEIIINTTTELSDLDKHILSLLAGGVSLPVEGEFVSEAEEPEEKVAPAKKAAKKAAAKPEPTPEPMAEEPLEEPEAEEEDDTEEQSDEELLALAVKKATEMVAGGQAAQVREALDAAGAARVRELNKDNVRDFFKALS